MNILITGGRAPASLEIARCFKYAGHSVFMAESLPNYLSLPSNAVSSNFLVPPPRQETSEFLKSIRKIIIEQNIEFLLPTCEEVFYISMGLGEFPCSVFVEPLNKLEILHNKFKFVNLAKTFGLEVPETYLINHISQLPELFKRLPNLVIKPVYSRFASKTILRPTMEQAEAAIKMNPNIAWAAQAFVDGRQICTYSICHNGKILAHTAYPSTFTAGQGATIFFEHLNHAKIFSWVEKFVQSNKFTGQIAFDFIETNKGDVFALECNPRATSGAHLLGLNKHFAESFLNPDMKCIQPELSNQSLMLASAMLIYGLPDSVRSKYFGKWLKSFTSSQDVIFKLRDPLPFFMQGASILSYIILSIKQKVSLLEASTYDIEWNGV